MFSDRMVFVRAVVDAQWMTPMELAIYDSWFTPLVEQLGCLVGGCAVGAGQRWGCCMWGCACQQMLLVAAPATQTSDGVLAAACWRGSIGTWHPHIAA